MTEYKQPICNRIRDAIAKYIKSNTGNEIEIRLGSFSGAEHRFTSGIDIDTFSLIHNNIKKIADEYEDKNDMINVSTSLDISVNGENASKMRLTINDKNKIIKYCQNGKIDITDPNIVLMTKTNVYKTDLLESNLRIGYAKEIKLSASDSEGIINQIHDSPEKFYRYKYRYSFTYFNFRYDLTIAKSGSGSSLTESKTLAAKEQYEIEIEHIDSGSDSDDKIVDEDLDLIYDIIRWRDQTFVVLDSSASDTVMKSYNELLDYKGFVSPKVAPLTRNLLAGNNTSDINKNFAVTHKIDGVHHLMFINDKGLVYLIDDTPKPKYTGYICASFANSIFECEYVDSLKRIYTYDCLFFKGVSCKDLPMINITNAAEHNLPDLMIIGREKHMEHINAGMPADAAKLSRMSCVLALNGITLTGNWDGLESPDLKFWIKTHLYSKSDIFARNAIILDNQKAENFGIPVDGLILTKADQVYPLPKKNQKLEMTFKNVYKYKPIEHQTIDLLVEISASKVTLSTGVGLNVNLYARDRGNLVVFQKAILMFRPDENVLKTIDGGTITNNSVVEFQYNLNTGMWIAVRLRPDKTIKRAPNALLTAQSTFDLIKNPITDKNIRGEEFVDATEKKYKTVTDEAEKAKVKRLRKYHNSIKQELISGCASVIRRDFMKSLRGKSKSISLADFACGQANDISRWNLARINFVLGIDYDVNQIVNGNGFIRTLKEEKKLSPSLNINLFAGDLSKSIDLCAQEPSGQKIFVKYSSKIGTYDIVSCQFAIHYFFKNETTLAYFLTNVTRMLRIGGYFIGTTLNGKAVNELFVRNSNEKDPDTVNIGNGLYIMTKKYSDEDLKRGTGATVDFAHIAGLTENQTEWLVDFDYLTKRAADFGLQPATIGNFNGIELFKDLSLNPLLASFATEMTADEKQYSYLNALFIFKKVA